LRLGAAGKICGQINLQFPNLRFLVKKACVAGKNMLLYLSICAPMQARTKSIPLPGARETEGLKDTGNECYV
jgi:hypothetical protein